MSTASDSAAPAPLAPPEATLTLTAPAAPRSPSSARLRPPSRTSPTVAVRLPAKAVGQEQLAARVQLAIGDDVTAQGLVKATWSNNSELTAKIDKQVAHYTGQTELASMIQEGLAAKAVDDEKEGTVRLKRTVDTASTKTTRIKK